MILDNIQRNILIDNVKQMAKESNGSMNTYVSVVGGKKIYTVETDGNIIIFEDFIDPGTYIFDSLKEFRDFLNKEFR